MGSSYALLLLLVLAGIIVYIVMKPPSDDNSDDKTDHGNSSKWSDYISEVYSGGHCTGWSWESNASHDDLKAKSGAKPPKNITRAFRRALDDSQENGQGDPTQVDCYGGSYANDLPGGKCPRDDGGYSGDHTWHNTHLNNPEVCPREYTAWSIKCTNANEIFAGWGQKLDISKCLPSYTKKWSDYISEVYSGGHCTGWSQQSPDTHIALKAKSGAKPPKNITRAFRRALDDSQENGQGDPTQVDCYGGSYANDLPGGKCPRDDSGYSGDHAWHNTHLNNPEVCPMEYTAWSIKCTNANEIFAGWGQKLDISRCLPSS